MPESELAATLRLAIPLVLAELGWMAMGNADIMFVGRVSAAAIAAVSLGTIVFYGISVCAGGVLLGLDTLVSQAFGANDRNRTRRLLIQGLWVSLLLIPAIMTIIRGIDPFLGLWGVNPEILNGTRPYLRVLNWSTPALTLYFCLRRYLQAIHVVRPVMWVLLTANLVNLAGNWIFVFGHLGAPALGAVGSAWATWFSRVYMAIAVGVILRRTDVGLFGWIAAGNWRPDWRMIGELFRIGAPAAGQLGVEIGVFAVVTVLVGRLNAAALAGHQIALTTVSTTFMMPLGISSAAAVRVGHRLGRGDPAGAARSGWMAVRLGAGVMSCAALLLLLEPQFIARLFTPEANVISAAATLLQIAAFFQLFDGLQVVTTGALRGAGDTRTPMLCHFAGYWIVGLPLGVWLGFSRGWGAAGLWTGLSVGLIVIGIVLTIFWHRTASRFRTLPFAQQQPPMVR